MQLLTFLPALLFTTLTIAGNDQVALKPTTQDLKVPGKNPLTFCEAPDNYILNLDNVDLDPNPPQAGKPLAIAANGTLNERIQDGAKVHIEVKYGVIRLIRQEVELCDYVDQVDLACPLKEGPKNLVKSVDLPNEIPPGKYTVLADVFNPDSSKVTCLTATINFSKGGGSAGWW